MWRKVNRDRTPDSNGAGNSQLQKQILGRVSAFNRLRQSQQQPIYSQDGDSSDDDIEIMYDLHGAQRNVMLTDASKANPPQPSSQSKSKSSYERLAQFRPKLNSQSSSSFVYPEEEEMSHPFSAATPISTVIDAEKSAVLSTFNFSEEEDQPIVPSPKSQILSSASPQKVTQSQQKKDHSISQKKKKQKKKIEHIEIPSSPIEIIEDSPISHSYKSDDFIVIDDYSPSGERIGSFSDDELDDPFSHPPQVVIPSRPIASQRDRLGRRMTNELEEDIIDDGFDEDENIEDHEMQEVVEIQPDPPKPSNGGGGWLDRLRANQSTSIPGKKIDRPEFEKKIKSNSGYAGRLKRVLNDTINNYTTIQYHRSEMQRFTSSAPSATPSQPQSVESIILRILHERDEFGVCFTTCSIITDNSHHDGYSGQYIDVIFMSETKTKLHLKCGSVVEIFKPYSEYNLKPRPVIMCTFFAEIPKHHQSSTATELKKEIEQLITALKRPMFSELSTVTTPKRRRRKQSAQTSNRRSAKKK